MKLLNRLHFAEVGLPVDGVVRATLDDEPADLVSKGAAHADEVVSKLRALRDYIRGPNGSGVYFREATKAERYLTILDQRQVGGTS